MDPQPHPTQMAEALDSAGVASLLLARDNEPAAPEPALPAAPEPVPGSSSSSSPADDGDEPLSVRIPTDADDDDEVDPPADSEPEPEAEAKHWPESASKRVAKLTAQKHALAEEKERAEQRARELEAELAEARHAVPPPPGDEPHADITTPQELEEQRDAAMKALDWLIANPYGGEVPDGKGGHVSLSAQDVAERRVHVERVLQVQLPKRERWLMEHARVSETASRVYPELFKAGPQSDAAFGVLRELPELQRRPDYVLTVGDILVGRAVRSGKYVLVPRGERKPAPARAAAAAPAVPPATSPASGVPAPTDRAAEQARARFSETGEAHDLARVIEARLAS